MRLGFIGAGTVGTALAVNLSGLGYVVVAALSRSQSSAERLVSRVNEAHPAMCTVMHTPQQVADLCDLVFVTTSDDVIVPVVNQIRWRPGQYVVHCSGALSNADLAGIAGSGAMAGGFHPLQSFADVEEAIKNLPGSAFGLEATDPPLGVLKEMAERLGGTWVCLRPEDKVLYHTAAVMTSNYTVALMKMATDLWQQFGVSGSAATEALLPLLRGTIDNIARAGLAGSLTGPIARGDCGTVAKHLKALSRSAPELLPVYCSLGLQTLEVAVDQGKITAPQTETLRQALAGGIALPSKSGERSGVGDRRNGGSRPTRRINREE